MSIRQTVAELWRVRGLQWEAARESARRQSEALRGVAESACG